MKKMSIPGVYHTLLALVLAIMSAQSIVIMLLPGLVNELTSIICLLVLAVPLTHLIVNSANVNRDNLKRTLKFSYLPFFYLMLISLIERYSPNLQPLEAYSWIILIAITALIYLGVLTGYDKLPNHALMPIHVIFVFEMFRNHDSQLIWLVAIPYVLMMMIYNSKRSSFELAIPALVTAYLTGVTCIILSIVQFWTAITSFFSYLIYGLSTFTQVTILMGLAIVILLLIYRHHVQTQRRNIEAERIRQEEEKAAQAAEIKRKQEYAQMIQHDLYAKILSGEITLNEFNQCSKETLNKAKSKWMTLVKKQNLTDLIQISKTKKQMVWDQAELHEALTRYNAMLETTQDDELIAVLFCKVEQLKGLLTFNFIGTEALQNQIRRDANLYCGF